MACFMLSQVVPATGMGIFWNLNGDPYMLLPPYSSTATITNTPQFINTLGLSAVVGQYYYFYAYWPSNNDELGYISLSPRVCDVLLLASRDKHFCVLMVLQCALHCACCSVFDTTDSTGSEIYLLNQNNAGSTPISQLYAVNSMPDGKPALLQVAGEAGATIATTYIYYQRLADGSSRIGDLPTRVRRRADYWSRPLLLPPCNPSLSLSLVHRSTPFRPPKSAWPLTPRALCCCLWTPCPS